MVSYQVVGKVSSFIKTFFKHTLKLIRVFATILKIFVSPRVYVSNSNVFFLFLFAGWDFLRALGEKDFYFRDPATRVGK